MIASSWRKAATLVLIASAALFVPGAAHAAPSILSVTVYGNTTPTHPDAASTTKGAGVVFANSAPYGPATYDDGMVFFTGTATAGVEILITVDEFPDDPTTPTINHRVTTRPAGQPSPGYFSGEIGNCTSCMKIQELGTHAATVTDSTDPDPTKWGKTVLRLGFQARNSLGELSAITTADITKFAGTPGDSAAPEFRATKMPPELWCHNSQLLSGDLFLFGEGGTIEFGCGTNELHQDPVVTPPLTICPEGNFRITIGNVRTDTCTGVGVVGSTGTECVCGYVVDNTKASYNVASEIAEVVVTITDGALTAPRVYKPDLSRGGSQAGYGVQLHVNDFEPTFPAEITGLDPYTITVETKDAWGKVASFSQQVDVAPF